MRTGRCLHYFSFLFLPVFLKLVELVDTGLGRDRIRFVSLKFYFLQSEVVYYETM